MTLYVVLTHAESFLGGVDMIGAWGPFDRDLADRIAKQHREGALERGFDTEDVIVVPLRDWTVAAAFGDDHE